MFLYFSKKEIDGFFADKNSFYINYFKVEKILPAYCNLEDFQAIKENKYLIYGNKSRNNLLSLVNKSKTFFILLLNILEFFQNMILMIRRYF